MNSKINSFNEVISRKEAIQRAVLLMGGIIVGAHTLLRAEVSAPMHTYNFTDSNIELLDEIADIIIPATDIPGAKAVNSGAFISMFVKDCYSAEEARIFSEGLNQFSELCVKSQGKSFLSCSAAERIEIITQLDKENKQHKLKAKPAALSHYFGMIKELTLLSYYTSEVGATQALRYMEVPGYFNGSFPYKKGDRAWCV
jgi:hypothetical protein